MSLNIKNHKNVLKNVSQFKISSVTTFFIIVNLVLYYFTEQLFSKIYSLNHYKLTLKLFENLKC